MTLLSNKNKILAFFLLVATLCNYFFPSLVYATVSLPIHEIGHAICAWLGSRPAFPVIFGGFTFIMYDRSTLLTILILIVLSYFLFTFYKKQSQKLFISAIIITLIFIRFTFLISEQKLEEYILLSGQVAEILVPSFFISFYFYNYLGLKTWLFWKNFLGFYGSMGIVFSSSLWFGVWKGYKSLPMGSIISSEGATSSDGDLNKLIELGWTELSLQNYFVKLWVASLIFILFSYILSLLESKTSP